MLTKKTVAYINILAYQIGSMWCCIMLKFGFHTATNVDFFKTVAFQLYNDVKGEHMFTATDYIYF